MSTPAHRLELVGDAAPESENAGIIDLIARFPGIEIIGQREPGIVEAQVPLEYIYTKDVPVDSAHVDELAESIEVEATKNGRDGQLSPVLLAEINESQALAIIDGFHRVAANNELGKESVYARIRLDSTWEEVIDLRILSANMHRAVRFSRVVEWVGAAWEKTPWADVLTPAQAFAIANNNTKVNKELGQAQTEELKRWVNGKCEQWKLSRGAVYSYLSVASIADPGLVNEARESKGGHTLEAITPAHLKAIAKHLPNRHEIQVLVANMAKQNNLTVPLTRALAKKMATAEDIEEAEGMVHPALIDSLEPEYEETKTRELSRTGGAATGGGARGTAAYRNPELLQTIFINELEIAKLSLENLILRGRYIVPPVTAKEAPSVELPRDQQEIALNKVGLGVDTVWKPEARLHLAVRVKELSGKMKLKLTSDMNFSSAEATEILDAVNGRIMADIMTGGLRFNQVDSDGIINSLFINCLRSEINARRRALQAVPDNELEPYNPQPTDLTARSIEGTLSEFDSNSRKILILNFVYKLSPHITSQILGVKTAQVEAVIPQLTKNLVYRATHRRSFEDDLDI